MYDIKQMKQLLKLMNENGLSEISISKGEDSICLKKPGSEIVTGVPGSVPVMPQMQFAPIQNTDNADKIDTKKEEVLADNVVEIKAPMVGTFYKSPSPDSDPFVEVGSVIKEGSALCILEAMKLMNEVKSEISGKIVKILVENAQPVEFDQPLFLVEK